MRVTGRIDVHQHVLPPFWVEGLRERGSVHRPPDWAPAQAIAFMDSRDIATGFLSLTAPGLAAWSDGESREMARKVNDYTADLVARWPERFGNFATLPLPDVVGALAEVAYALDELGAQGVVLYSNYGDRYLGHPSFEPLWAELDRRQAIVFIHPTRTTLPELEGIPAPFVDFPFATTRTAVDMVLKGVLDRHRRVRVILSHAGGFLPYTVQRIVACATTLPGSIGTDALQESFRRFYFDTALSSGLSTIPSLMAFADPSRILFGSDFPYAPGGPAEQFTAALDASTDLSDVAHAAIDHDNAASILPSRR
ncbi:amidohydrolase family protein [Amycolatopsis sp. H20-H5]|uniref:amidohydrolase family protein n=1 Tax=Amycolatopsis sp. H20-H5 TaxID=3046309 RepID=UPI002DBC8E28|nr:amidohydrolase family protein [Amycolatopsis sp. H20-H5]MEC3974459.1 amidohydrolase family protein [Amycolatopsis sp. H20-H5]